MAGTTLYIPVHAFGGLFLVSDGHAGQGNGEVNVAALETALTGTFQFIVRKDMHLRWTRAEAPTHYITMGMHEDLTETTKLAIRDGIDFLITEKRLTGDEPTCCRAWPWTSTPRNWRTATSASTHDSEIDLEGPLGITLMDLSAALANPSLLCLILFFRRSRSQL